MVVPLSFALSPPYFLPSSSEEEKLALKYATALQIGEDRGVLSKCEEPLAHFFEYKKMTEPNYMLESLLLALARYVTREQAEKLLDPDSRIPPIRRMILMYIAEQHGAAPSWQGLEPVQGLSAVPNWHNAWNDLLRERQSRPVARAAGLTGSPWLGSSAASAASSFVLSPAFGPASSPPSALPFSVAVAPPPNGGAMSSPLLPGLPFASAGGAVAVPVPFPVAQRISEERITTYVQSFFASVPWKHVGGVQRQGQPPISQLGLEITSEQEAADVVMRIRTVFARITRGDKGVIQEGLSNLFLGRELLLAYILSVPAEIEIERNISEHALSIGLDSEKYVWHRYLLEQSVPLRQKLALQRACKRRLNKRSLDPSSDQSASLPRKRRKAGPVREAPSAPPQQNGEHALPSLLPPSTHEEMSLLPPVAAPSNGGFSREEGLVPLPSPPPPPPLRGSSGEEARSMMADPLPSGSFLDFFRAGGGGPAPSPPPPLFPQVSGGSDELPKGCPSSSQP